MQIFFVKPLPKIHLVEKVRGEHDEEIFLLLHKDLHMLNDFIVMSGFSTSRQVLKMYISISALDNE